jgi:hypothetical protein
MPYDLSDFGRIYKDENSYDGQATIQAGNVIIPSAKIQRWLKTVEDANWCGGDKSDQDFAVIAALLDSGHSPQDALATFLASPRGDDARERKHSVQDYLQRTICKATVDSANGFSVSALIIDGKEVPLGDEPKPEASDWRKGFKSKNQLCRDVPRYLVQRLVPEKALTFITAPSFHGKSWLVLHLGAAISVGKGLWGFKGPEKAVPFRYHVPEMSESLVRQRMEQLHIANSDMFLVRAMESGEVWGLNDERMLSSARGAVVCLDTTGYFNEADDTSSYQQSVKFGKLVFKLLTEGGAMAVIGLYHPPKYSDKETDLTLENSVLGSAGYGGILRSCLAVRNLNADLNDEKLRLYVQGLKNPRLKPFQLAGLPLTMSVRPGESPYLSGIVRDQKQNKQHQQKQERQMQVLELLKQGNSVRGIAEKLKISHNTVRAIRDEFEDE